MTDQNDTAIPNNAGSKEKNTAAAKSSILQKMQIRLALAAFILRDTFSSLGKRIVPTAKSDGTAADRQTGGKASAVLHKIFAVLTLEGPRLLLISRHRAAAMDKKKKIGLSAIGGSAVAAVIVITVLIGSQLLAVTVDGRVIGYVSDEGQYAALVQRAKEKISEQVGTEDTEILIQESNVSLNTVIAPTQTPLAITDSVSAATDETAPIDATGTNQGGILDALGGTSEPSDTTVDEDALADLLAESLVDDGAVMTSLYTITVNGTAMATLGSMKEASDVLQAIADMYTPSEGDFTGEKFQEDVSIDSVTTDINNVDVQSTDEVVAYLTTGTAVEKSYTAVGDDTLGNICAALSVSEGTLREAYPEYDFDKINEGDMFAVTVNVPFVNYSTTGVEITTEAIQFETIEEKTDELNLGTRETKVEGVPGERRVTSNVSRVNGMIITSEEIGSETILEPVAETILVGTNLTFISGELSGDGPLGRPLTGWYLSRTVGGGHQGADMLAERGTPIYAAESGTVTRSDYWGGYGNIVMIDHGGGLVTYYAHCDTLGVSVGQYVSRGEQIATVGTTGRSTAYHLHFEVRVNGAVQEPMGWIS